jgi:hypothetical protein
MISRRVSLAAFRMHLMRRLIISKRTCFFEVPVRAQPLLFLCLVLSAAVCLATFDPPAVAEGAEGRSEQSAVLAAQQFPQTMPQFPPPLSTPNGPTPADQAQRRMRKEMAKKANHERQMQLKRDTDKLLKLAKELKQYVDETNEDILSVDVVKKANEIEKLAHSVKEKMKND